MWIMTTNGLLSIVDKDSNPNNLVVRARQRAALEAMFPGRAGDVIEGGGTDYEYRLILPRDVVSRAIADSVSGIDYPNFKSAVKNRALHDAYLRVWQVMAKLSD